MVEFPIPEPMLARARKMAADIGQLDRSILEGKGNLAGCVGELAASWYASGRFPPSWNSQFDLTLPDGRLVDVKTLQTSLIIEPPLHFSAAYPAPARPSQGCDLYVFGRANLPWSKGWLVGYLSRDDFWRRAQFNAEGTVDEARNPNGYRAGTYSVLIGELLPMKDLLDLQVSA